MNKFKMIAFISGFSLAVFICYIVYVFVLLEAGNSESARPAEKQPLYWVAPMDDNFRRDKPGKSPMGMDLVPVYAEDQQNDSPGTITISAQVINNLSVKTSAVQLKQLKQVVTTSGIVRFDEDRILHIHPRVSGWVEKLYVKSLGEQVEKGQPLYQLYSPELVNAQEELLLALDRGNEKLKRAAKSRLHALHLSSATINDIIESREVMQKITIYSPQQGVIEHFPIREGFYVKPGSTIMSISDLSQVWLELDVLTSQLAQIKNNASVDIRFSALPKLIIKGQVDYIYPTVDVTTRTAKVRVRLNNEKRLIKPNMYANATIHHDSDKQVLVIPKQALIRNAEQNKVVLALAGGKFKSIAVEVGQFDRQFVEITSGLELGDRIVSSAQFLLDSESSKSSDFLRMSPDNKQATQSDVISTKNTSTAKISQASVDGVINHIDSENGVINISRAAITKWQRPPATVNFLIGDDVDISALKAGLFIHFTFTVNNGNFTLINFTIPVNSQQPLVKEQEKNASQEAL